MENKMNLMALVMMFRQKEKRMNFIAKCILVFDVRTSTLSRLLKMDEGELIRQLYDTKYAPYFLSGEAIFYVPEEEAEQNFLNYFNQLEVLYLNKDIEGYNKLLDVINDKGIKEIKIKRSFEHPKPLTNSEFIAILNYQVKYRIPSTDAIAMFRFTTQSYKNKIIKLEQSGKYANLIKKIYILNDHEEKVLDLGKIALK